MSLQFFALSDMLSIRPAEPGEALCLSDIAIRSKASRGYSPEFMEACRAELSISEADIESLSLHRLVAEIDGKIVGYYALVPLAPEEWELDSLFVEPRFFGRGIGRALIEHAKSYGRRNGVASLILQADPHAVDFYLAAGGVWIGERESGSIPGRFLPEFRIVL